MSSSEPKIIFGPVTTGDGEIQRIVAHADGSVRTELWNFETRTWQRGGRFSILSLTQSAAGAGRKARS